MQPIVLRAGIIYGRGIKLIEAARRLMAWRLLVIWCEPTWLHLLALPDFLKIIEIAVENPRLSGIYNICDDRPVLIQAFVNRLAQHWGYRTPWRLPKPAFFATAAACET